MSTEHLISSFDRHHPFAVVRIRVTVTLWLLLLCAITCAYFSWWGLLFIVPAAANFYLGYTVWRHLVKS